ncbi:MAG: Rv3654c family TadE-like protein [Nocardioides sp.]
MSRRWSPHRGSQRGSATVLALPLLGALTVVAVLLAYVGGALTTRRKVAAAADLAALAGAAELQAGGDGCAAAATVAARNGGDLGACTVHGLELSVTVTARTEPLLGRRLVVSARARAGPAAP